VCTGILSRPTSSLARPQTPERPLCPQGPAHSTTLPQVFSVVAPSAVLVLRTTRSISLKEQLPSGARPQGQGEGDQGSPWGKVLPGAPVTAGARLPAQLYLVS